MASNVTEKLTHNIGGSIFWILISAVAIFGMIYLSIWAYQNQSVQGALLAFMAFIMLIVGIIFSRFEIFNMGTWRENAVSFTLGFGLWAGFSSIIGLQSVIAPPQNQLFSTVTGQMPQLLNYLMNVFVIPIAEEMAWVIALPYIFFTIFDVLGKRWSIFSNFLFQMVIIVIIAGVSFGAFHVAKLNWAFLIAAFMFRMSVLVIPWIDMKKNVIKGVQIVASFALGAHIGSNMLSFGLSEGLTILMANFWTVGWIITLIFAAIFISAVDTLIDLIDRIFLQGGSDKNVQ